MCLLQELCVGIEGVLLSSTYPRRELTTDMEDNSLEQLSLAPSGVVVVRLKRVSLAALVFVYMLSDTKCCVFKNFQLQYMQAHWLSCCLDTT